MECTKCGNENSVKAGYVKGEQRYKCKGFGYQFVPTRCKGKPEKDKQLAIWLYLHGLSFRTIAKLIKVTHKTIHDWVKAYAINIKEKLPYACGGYLEGGGGWSPTVKILFSIIAIF